MSERGVVGGGTGQGSLDRVIVYVKQDRDAKDGRLVDKRGQPLPREPRPGSESNMRPDANNMRCVRGGPRSRCCARDTKKKTDHGACLVGTWDRTGVAGYTASK